MRGQALALLFFLEVAEGFRAIHDEVFHAIRVGDGAELKALFFAGSLDVDIAVVEESLKKSVDFDRNVLDAGELELAHFAREEPVLFDIDDAAARDDPGIEPDIDPDEKDVDPPEEKDGVFDEEKESSVVRCEELREQEWEGDEREEERSHETDNGEKVHEDIEPVAVRYAEHAFFGAEKIIDNLHKDERECWILDTGYRRRETP